MRPYISLMELPINRPGSGNLLLGLTSVVGLIGGAYLLQCGAQCLLGKLANKKWRKEEPSEDHTCNVCCADLDLSSAKNYVTCRTCRKSVCRGLKCADWRPKDASWECQLCQSTKESLAQTSSWVAEQMSFNQHKFVYPMRARSEVYIPIVGNDGNDSSMRKDKSTYIGYGKCIQDILAEFESVSQIGLPANSDERAKIREYVEEIVAEMLGGNLDHIKVGQLSKSENYLELFDKYHAKLSNLLINVENGLCALALKGDLPAIVNGHHNGTGIGNQNNNNNNNNNNNGDSELADISQTRLRSLIETIIAETLRSSSLSASGAVSEISLDTRSQLGASELANGNGLKRRHRTEHYFEPKIYQDLLATAVLNKIADKEGNTRLLAESTPDLSGRHIDENFNAEALSTTSGSSIEPRSDCSLTDHEIVLDNGKSQSLQADLERESVLSDYIAAHMVPLPDFSASVTESEDDIGSISSSMIGDGNWEDNWLFKKKRSSVTPSSTGMLVPAPKENIRAQIGDKTADEVSDLSEMGSDAEDSSLDLLRSNDLNDRLLSKHLIGGQNTKLVLDELVDRTSLTSHTLPEEHEPAFTETTNAFVVSPPAAPTVPPPPMIFQDDSLNEELTHTPIAAQAESEELASLDGCTGFSTVEYIDEEQMHENVPSVIEILAAMALGPMLAVPASEQPGAMTPSEMHTLKELSDLALAEINARTMDLVHHHSLDIIEEENTDLAETAQFSSIESSAPEVVQGSNSLAVELPESVEDIADVESVLAPQNDEITLEAISKNFKVLLSNNPPATEATKSPEAEPLTPVGFIIECQNTEEPKALNDVLPETRPSVVEPPAALEIIPDIEPPAPDNILPESQSTDLEPPATEKTIPPEEIVSVESVAPVEIQTGEPAAPLEVAPVVESPVPAEILLESQSTDLEPPAADETIPQEEIVALEAAAPVEVIPETQTGEPAAPLKVAPNVEAPAPAEILPESQSTHVEPPATVETIPQKERVAVESVASAEVITETQTAAPAVPLEIAPVVEPPAPAEILPETQSTDVEPPAMEETIPQEEIVAVESVVAMEVIPETQTGEPAAPLEVVPVVELPAPTEILPETHSSDVEPPATEETIPPEEIVSSESVASVKVIPEPQTVAPAAPLEVAPVVEPPAPAEILPETQSTDVEPLAMEETIPQEEIVAVESVVAMEVIPETQTGEPAAPLEVAPVVEPPSPAEILPATQSTDVEPPATEETIPQAEIVAVESVASVEVIPETQTGEPAAPLEVAPDVEPPAPAEILPESQSTDVEPSATEETTSPEEILSSESVAPVKVIPEPQTVAPAAPLEVAPVVEPPAPAEILPETQSTDVEPLAMEETIPQEEIVAVESVVAMEVIPETQTGEPAAPLEVAPVVEPPSPAEILPATQSTDVEPPATEETIPQEEIVAVESVAPVEVIPETQTGEPAAPLQVAPVVEAPSPAEILPATQSTDLEPPATEETIPQAEIVAVESVTPVEVIPETHTGEPATPLEVAPDVESPAPAEILPETQSTNVEPPAMEETIPQEEIVAVESVAPMEVIPETLTGEPAAPLEVAPDVEAPAPAEILPETQSTDVEPPATEETIPPEEIVSSESVAPVEVIPETQTGEPAAPLEVAPVVEPPAPAEILPATQSTDVEPPATEETIPQEEIVAVESVAPMEVIPETLTREPAAPLQVAPDVEAPAPAEILPETQSTDVEPPATEETIPQEEIVAVKSVAPMEVIPETLTGEPAAPLEVAPDVEAPAPAEILPETQSTDVEPPATEETIPQEEIVSSESVAPVEVIPETQTGEPAAPLEVVPVVEAPAPAEILPELQSTDVEPPATEETISPEEILSSESVAPVEVIPETQTVAPAAPLEIAPVVEPPAPAEILPESQSTDVEPPATEETIPPEEIVSSESVAPVEVIPETLTGEPAAPLEVAPVVEPPAPAEILPETQSTDVEPPAMEETIPQEESVAPVEVIPETQTGEPAAPLEVVPVVEPPAPAEILPESQSTDVEPPATEETIPPKEIVSSESVAPVEVIPETQTGEPVAPLEVVPVVELPAPAEILPETQSTNVEPPAMEETIPQEEIVAVESVGPVEVIPETQTGEPAAPLEAAPVVEAPSPAEILPATQSTDLEPPATEETIPQEEIVAVESVAHVEVIPESQTGEPAAPLEVAPDVEVPAPAEILPELQSNDVEPPATEETIPQEEIVAVESVVAMEVNPETQTVAPAAPLEIAPVVEPPAPAEILPESQSTDVEPPAMEETIPPEEIVSSESMAPVEVIPETQTGEPAAPLDIAPDVEPPAPAEILPESQSGDVEPATKRDNFPGDIICKSQSTDEEAQLDYVVPEAQSIVVALEGVPRNESVTEDSHALQELVSKTSQAEKESVAEKADPETQTIQENAELLPSGPSPSNEQITSTSEPLPRKDSLEAEKPVVEPVLERNSSLESSKGDCSALGKTSQKCLRRQPNIPDTTPSDGNSPVKSESLNLLGTICKFYIKDKRLLATIERRRRRSLIMHKYLSSFDSTEDSIDTETHPSIFEELNEDSLASFSELQPPTERAATPTSETEPLDTFETAADFIDNVRVGTEESQCFLSPQNNPKAHPNFNLESEANAVREPRIDTDRSHHLISMDDKLEPHLNHLEDDVTETDYSAATVRLDMASQTSCDMSHEQDVETESLIVFSLSDITYNFINEILFSDQLSTESHYSDDSEPSTACETFNGEGDLEQEFVSQTVLVLDEHRSLSTNTSSNSTLHSNLHLPLTQTNNIPSGSRRTNGKLTNGSLKWSGSYTTELTIGGSVAAQQDGVAAEDDDVVLLRRFVPGSIAEREVKKWYNAVEMPNNPYAPEALKQRISGTQERYMDVPNISPSAEQKALASALTENTDPPSPQTDYKRYSRDYYINNAPKDSTGSVRAPASSSFVDQQRSTGEDVEDIVINEVNQEPEPLLPHGRISSSAQSNVADLSHWTLSTPVRRSSSLKFINSRPSPRTSASTAPHSLAYERSATLERPSTSASHYRESGLGDDIDDDFDVRSQRSWRSSYSSLPKRHTQSSLSLHSNGSGMSFGSSVSKRRQAAGGGGPSAGVLTQFEKQLLHKDLKRNSFRAVSSTSKDFVMNPLFESEAFGGKPTLRPETEDQGDSGVDSCLNGFSGADAKYSNNSLLF
ncbi:hypothetical protein KR038_003618 [Drosophila bunnanda]|nr:hypothetical protein KR038_003618 [Drosophila bunnanda]